MKHSQVISGSTCERRMNCPGSMELSKKVPPSPPNKYTREGVMLHEVMPEVIDRTKTPEQLIAEGFTYEGHTLTDELVDEMITPALTHFDTLQEKYGEMEFVTEAHVQYADIPDAYGTVDLLASTARATILLDWKFGRGVKVKGGADNKQLLFYAGAARETAALADMFEPDKPIVLAIIQPAMHEPLTYEEVGDNVLTDFVEEMKATVRMTLAGDTTLNIGDWCRWCPAAGICPEKQNMAEELLDSDLDAIYNDSSAMGELVRLANDMSDWVREVHRLAFRQLKDGNLVDGYKIVNKRTTREWVDPATTEERFRAAHIKVSDFRCAKLVSPAGAEKLLKRLKKKIDLSALIVSRSSGTTLVDADDPRPPIHSGDRNGSLNLPAADESENENA